MRKAFDENSGSLMDSSLVISERQATSHLFAGAIGLFKNPTSHRASAISKTEDAIELVMFADYLLRLVDAPAPKVSSTIRRFSSTDLRRLFT